MNLYDLVNAQEVGSYVTTVGSNQIPMLGEVLFPSEQKLGLKLGWVKGSRGLAVALKPSAFDSNATLRDRIGMDKLESSMPFFKEAMRINEEDRQQLNMLLATGNQAMIDIALKTIFDDAKSLVDGAAVVRERMRMQLLSTGKISIVSNGVNLEFDYQFKATLKETLAGTDAWSDIANSRPVEDIDGWMDTVEDESGERPERAICTKKTWNYLKNNESIRNDMNLTNGQKIIMSDSMLQEYFKKKLGLTIVVYSKRYKDEKGNTHSYFSDDVFTLLPSGTLGKTWFGTTPEQSDLLNNASSSTDVAIVDTGVAITTKQLDDPVTVETKVSEIVLPSFESCDHCFIANVA